jgi:hypothetical protein
MGAAMSERFEEVAGEPKKRYRLVIDRHALVSFPWYRVEQWDSAMKWWRFYESGTEDKMRIIFEDLCARRDRYEVIEEREV